MKGINMTTRLTSLLLAALVLVCTLFSGVVASAADVYLCNPTSLTAVYNTVTETMTYKGTFTGILQPTRTYTFTLNSGYSMITLSSVSGADLDQGGNSFAYSFHLDKSMLDQFATPWRVTFSCFTASMVNPTVAEVSFRNTAGYTVTFVDYDGSVLLTQTVEDGDAATAPADPVLEGYTFIGWDKAFDNVTEDITVTAQYRINQHNVRFVAGAGGSISGQDMISVAHGTDISTLAFPDTVADYGYTFKGWSVEEGTVDKSLVITALFDKEDSLWHKVEFACSVGGTLNGASVYGAVLNGTNFSTLTVPTPVPNDGYRFVGWTPAFAETVDADQKYIAQFEYVGELPVVLDVTRAFYDGGCITVLGDSVGMQPQWDVAIRVQSGNVIVTHITVKYGDMIDSDDTFLYTFKINPKDISGDVTVYVKPVTVAVATDSQPVEYGLFSVSFAVSGNGTLQGDTVFENILNGTDFDAAVTVPTPIADEGYTFIGWDKEFAETVEGDAVYTAVFQPKTYTVVFKDYDGAEILTQTVEHGSSAIAPADPARDGYNFTGWDKAFDNVKGDLTVTATYALKTYTVIFKDYDGSVLKTQTVGHGASATAPEASREGYTFIGWDKAFNNVTAGLTVTAQYRINTYTVVFKDYDGTELLTQTVEHGSSAIAPADPARDGYNFTGWDKAFDNVKGDLTVTATYALKTYTVIFKDYDGSVLKTQTVGHGASATAPEASREGYTFIGWDKAFNNVTAGLTVTAQYRINTYTVVFKDYDGAEILTQTVEHGSSAIAPADPARDGYNFTGWDKAFDNVKGDLTVTALYSAKVFTVTFVDYDGSVIKTEDVKYGEGATAPTASRVGYTFSGWDTDYYRITESITVTAQYTINTYTVAFKDYDGTEILTQTVEHGSSAIAPADPVRDGYTFTGWDKAFDSITSDVVITAQYVANNVDVTFVIVGKGGSIIGNATVSVQKGTAFADISIPEVKTDSGYIFGGFDMPEGTVESAAQVSGKFYLKGDVNFDGEVDSLDAAQVLRYDVNSVAFDDIQLLVGDVNDDGEVDSLDAARILKLDAGIISEL